MLGKYTIEMTRQVKIGNGIVCTQKIKNHFTDEASWNSAWELLRYAAGTDGNARDDMFGFFISENGFQYFRYIEEI